VLRQPALPALHARSKALSLTPAARPAAKRAPQRGVMAEPAATPTARAQRDLETRIASIYRDLADLDAGGRVHRVHTGEEALTLQRGRHARYAAAGVGRLPAGFASLDASRPWICYWVLHSLALLREPLPEGVSTDDVVAFLAACAAPGGGYGGGPGQMAHLAPTYAAVCALLTLGGEAALASIDRAAILGFLRRMALPPSRGGGFTMHDGGEADARACYTAAAVAHMLNLDVAGLAEAGGIVDYLQRCQVGVGVVAAPLVGAAAALCRKWVGGHGDGRPQHRGAARTLCKPDEQGRRTDALQPRTPPFFSPHRPTRAV
jgi:hypothetical protein